MDEAFEKAYKELWPAKTNKNYRLKDAIKEKIWDRARAHQKEVDAGIAENCKYPEGHRRNEMITGFEKACDFITAKIREKE